MFLCQKRWQLSIFFKWKTKSSDCSDTIWCVLIKHQKPRLVLVFSIKQTLELLNICKTENLYHLQHMIHVIFDANLCSSESLYSFLTISFAVLSVPICAESLSLFPSFLLFLVLFLSAFGVSTYSFLFWCSVHCFSLFCLFSVSGVTKFMILSLEFAILLVNFIS